MVVLQVVISDEVAERIEEEDLDPLDWAQSVIDSEPIVWMNDEEED